MSETLNLDDPIERLPVAPWICTGLGYFSGMRTIRDLTQKTALEILRIPGFGYKDLYEIEAALQSHAWRLRPGDPPKWVPRPLSPKNAAILADVEAGMRQVDVAKKHGISASRVWQIVKRHNLRASP